MWNTHTKKNVLKDAGNQAVLVTIDFHCRVDWLYLGHMHNWNTLNNLDAQEAYKSWFLLHMHIIVLFDLESFVRCASLHSEDFHFTTSHPQWIAYYYPFMTIKLNLYQ